ncbi:MULTISPECIES: hypothetical protein [unclassified Frankia]|nr:MULTISPECIES: hypothetical protein [unclassified Frankia]
MPVLVPAEVDDVAVVDKTVVAVDVRRRVEIAQQVKRSQSRSAPSSR